MKIVITGGGTGGHFYPLMAVSESVIENAYKQKLTQPKIYYFGSEVYDATMLWERGIVFESVPSGKMRTYFSLENILDIFRNFAGFFVAFFKLFKIYPDVVFAKGGYDSLPTCLAAWILRIPIITHESDSVPGRVSVIVSKLATRVAVSYKESAQYLKSKYIAETGQPIIKKYLPDVSFTREYKTVGRKNILVIGGSQGSTRINDNIFQILPELLTKYNVVHQVGDKNLDEYKVRIAGMDKNLLSNYAVYDKIDLSKIYVNIDLAISRSGSTLFELAAWQIPTIAIPLPESHADHQKENAFICEHAGFVRVLLEDNMSPHIMFGVVNDILEDKGKYEHMMVSAKNFNNNNAANVIADEIINICLAHEIQI